MIDALHAFVFGIYPYIALSIFFLGSLARFDRDQYTWKSDSSQLLRRGELRWGSNLFHVGILVVFFGHLFGFLIPDAIGAALMTPSQHLLLAMVGGGIAGVVALVGLTILIYRRLSDPRILATSRRWDIAIVFILWIQLALGMWTVYLAMDHLDGILFEQLVAYVQGIVQFRPGNEQLLAGVPWVYQAHIALGLTIFLIFPFTRMVHIWSGFGSVYYLIRPPQIVRTRRHPAR
jgi:nitrate reductase gamma subunit